MAKQEREVEQWITVNGVHVPVFKGQSKEEAVKGVLDKQKVSKDSTGKGKSQQTQETGKTEQRTVTSVNFKHPHDTINNMHDIEDAMRDKKKGEQIQIGDTTYTKMNNEETLGVWKDNKTGVQYSNNQLVDMESRRAKEAAKNESKQTEEQKTISKNEDEKEQQIARNKAEAEERSKTLDESKSSMISATEQRLKQAQAYLAKDPNNKALQARVERHKQELDELKGWNTGKTISKSTGNTDERNGKKESFVVGNNPPTTKEQAYMNYKAIRISKNMPKAKQDELKRLKAQYKKEWEKLSGRK